MGTSIIVCGLLYVNPVTLCYYRLKEIFLYMSKGSYEYFNKIVVSKYHMLWTSFLPWKLLYRWMDEAVREEKILYAEIWAALKKKKLQYKNGNFGFNWGHIHLIQQHTCNVLCVCVTKINMFRNSLESISCEWTITFHSCRKSYTCSQMYCFRFLLYATIEN